METFEALFNSINYQLAGRDIKDNHYNKKLIYSLNSEVD